MTRTEERLIAALDSTAAAVPVDAMRPLVAPGQGLPGRAGPRREVTRRSHRSRVWLAALAAASIAAIAAVPVALNSQASLPVTRAAYIGGSEPAVPAFFVDAGSTGLYDGRLRVVSLATGAVTATELAPAGTGDITFLAEQAQTGNFVAAFEARQGEQALYRFRVTGTGKITPMTRIHGITIKQHAGSLAALALSPDGSRLALSWVPDNFPAAAASAELILLNLSTGARQVWKDSLADGAYYPDVTSAVWTPGGRALVFATHMCKLNADASVCFWEFRRLRTPLVGDGLQAGPVLLRQNGMGSQIQAPAISSDGSSVVEIRHGNAPGRPVALVRISLDTGEQAVLHHWGGPGTFQVGANEGNFLIVGQQLRPGGNKWLLRGWIDDRGFHSLTYPSNS
jgi:hypothetical protein